MEVPRFTICAKESRAEISPAKKKQSGKPEEGRIALRFFRITSGAHQIRFLAEPGFDLHLKINAVQVIGGKETLTHKFDSGEGETVTKLSVECCQKNGKKGYAFSVQGGEESVKVAAPLSEVLFAAEFLKGLAVTRFWVEQAER